jgi:uncharacterized protein
MSVGDGLGLSSHQSAIGERVIAEESARREHLVVYLSGAHAYGFPSPDSDLDLKSIHIARTSQLVGFDPPQPTFDRAEILEGVEIDYTSNEIAHVLSGVLNGNGNFLERILGRAALQTIPELDALRPLVRASICRRVYRHYRGFAANQQRLLEKDPTIKKLLYVLRTALTGTHLLRTGELETDLGRLADAYELREAREIVAAKRAGERTAADPGLLEEWRPKLEQALARLDTARDRSVLPEEPRGVAELEAWLIGVRRSRF